MQYSNVVNAAEQQLFSVPWKNALAHFRRSLIECGSTLELEHSHRIGLIFAKGVGKSMELQKWSSLFNAEEVPPTSLILKALVFHNQWKCAVSLFERNLDAPQIAETGEILVQFLMAKNLWTQSLEVVTKLLELPPLEPNCGAAAITNTELSDSTCLATCKNFVPDEERVAYCGLGSAVLRAFPKNSQWEEATSILCQLSSRAEGETRVKLLEVAAAKAVFCGRQYAWLLRWALHQREVEASLSIQRTIFFCGLRTRSWYSCCHALSAISKVGGSSTLSVRKLEELCAIFLMSLDNKIQNEELVKFASNFEVFGNRLTDQKIVSSVKKYLSLHGINVCLQGDFTGGIIGNSSSWTISELDRYVTKQLRQNNWKEALEAVDLVKNAVPLTETERHIFHCCRSSSWAEALRFFS